jgi:hypothetical protein
LSLTYLLTTRYTIRENATGSVRASLHCSPPGGSKWK